MYTSHNPCWDAKNRYGLPDEVPFSYESIRHIIEPERTDRRGEAVSQTGSGVPEEREDTEGRKGQDVPPPSSSKDQRSCGRMTGDSETSRLNRQTRKE